MSINPLQLAALVALIGALWLVDHTRSESERLAAELAASKSDASRLGELAARQAEALAEGQQLADRVTAIQSRLGDLTRTYRADAEQNRQALEELKRNDQIARAWMAGCVPAAVGLRYARHATTDPGAYAAPAVLPAVGVPAAGSPCAGDQ